MNKRNILVIGDIHEPFSLDGYIDFCKEQYKKFDCNQVVFIGDIIDNHFGSYHETDTDAYGAKYELEKCIKKVKKWYKAFPKADVCTGNHDQIVSRKAQTGGIPSAWIRDYSEVLGTPGWTWDTDFVYDNVRYTHGHKSSKARTAYKRDMMSTVTGHFHTDFYVEYNHGINGRIFAMAVGSGVDDSAYAVRYAAGGKKSAVGCGVVLDNGAQPVIIAMNQEEYKSLPKKKKKKKNKKKKGKNKKARFIQPISEMNNRQKLIENIETGERYTKQKDVQDILNISKGYLSRQLNGLLPNKTGFRYIN